MKKIEHKVINGEEVYFKNDLEGTVIKFMPGKGFWAKFPGKLPFKVAEDTPMVTDALLEGLEITKEAYANF